MNGENFDCEVSELVERLKRVRSIRKQSAWNVECALPELAVLVPVKVVVREIAGGLTDYPLAAHLSLRCSGLSESGQSSSIMQ